MDLGACQEEKEHLICWKAVLWAFDTIDTNLVWKVGNVADMRIGLDPYVGCKWRHQLPTSLLDKLHSEGIFFLKDIGCPSMTLMCEQGWLFGNTLGLSDPQDV